MESQNFQIYKTRFSTLAMFCLLNLCNSMLWVTFAPITDLTENYFGGEVGTLTNVNLLAISFQIFYLPGTLLGALCMKRFGLRLTMIFGGLLSVVGSALRLFGAIFRTQMDASANYFLFFIGQSIAAIGQPFFVNIPAAIAASWYPVDERDLATTVGALFNPVGNAVGQLLPVFFVSSSNTIEGMKVLMAVEAALCIFAVIIPYFFFVSEPPTPPSQSAKLKLDSAATEELGAGTAFSRTWLECVELMRDKDYVVLFIAFSVGLGVFNSLLTLIFQLVQPQGYSNDDAGTFGAILIVAGLIGAGIAGAILDKTHAYRPMLKFGFFACTGSMILFSCLLYPNNFGALSFAFALLGFVVLPMLPVVLENCAEATYPVAEELSIGLLFIGGNVLGIPFIFLLQYLIQLPPWGAPPLLPSNFALVLMVGAAWIMLLFYHGQYKRLQCEREKDPEMGRPNPAGKSRLSESMNTAIARVTEDSYVTQDMDPDPRFNYGLMPDESSGLVMACDNLSDSAGRSGNWNGNLSDSIKESSVVSSLLHAAKSSN